MINSIFVALSGMQGHQRGLSVISSNISNLNTPGFRGSTVSFSDVFIGTAQNGQFTGQRGLGGGLNASLTLLDLRNGDPQTTGRDLDLFLQGEGFFVVQDESGATRYTRNGRFDFNGDGDLVLQGQKTKVLARNAGGQLVPVSLAGLRVSAAKATTEVTFDRLLAVNDTDHTIEAVDVFDQLGTKHTLKVKFAKQPPSGSFVEWTVTVFEGTGTDEVEIGSSRLQFVAQGGILIDTAPRLTLALKDAGPLEVTFSFPDVRLSGNDLSDLVVKKQDGFTVGAIVGQKFDEKGVLKLTYSNGQTADGARLLLAQISDGSGLVQLGDSLFDYRGSQQVVLREPDSDLRVVGQSLELSNVDLTQAFSDLILMQRGFQASSQVVSTANDMLQELLQMKGGR